MNEEHLKLHPIFIDAEFSGLNQNAVLLSLALVPLDGPWFYAVFDDVDLVGLSAWHQDNVVPHLSLTAEQLVALQPGEYIIGSKTQVLARLKTYLAEFEDVVMWADVPAYDWVLFCELFGGALQLPKNIHYIVRDVATLLEVKGFDIDTDRFQLAYEGAAAGEVVSSGDGRVGKDQQKTTTTEGVLRHNALGDALACRECYSKLMSND